MCGRFTQTRSKEELIRRFLIQKDCFGSYRPHYNVAPAKEVPVVLKKDLRELHPMRWGLVPSWAKDPAIGHHMINARLETLTEKMSFKMSFKWRRCLVLADGFYEWRVEDHSKTPYWIYLPDHQPFGFAGLWSHWSSQAGDSIHSCAIITADANPSVRGLHDRMPVIVREADEEKWLDPNYDSEKDLLDLLARASEQAALKYHAVSRQVNDPRNDSPELIE